MYAAIGRSGTSQEGWEIDQSTVYPFIALIEGSPYDNTHPYDPIMRSKDSNELIDGQRTLTTDQVAEDCN